MGEQEKILIMINRWGYLNTEQIGLLVNKKKRATEELLKTFKTLSNWTQKIIRELNLFVNQHTYEIWKPNLDKGFKLWQKV